MAVEIMERYPSDWSAEWLWTSALLQYKSKGPDSNRAKKALREAVKQNPYVVLYIYWARCVAAECCTICDWEMTLLWFKKLTWKPWPQFDLFRLIQQLMAFCPLCLVRWCLHDIGTIFHSTFKQKFSIRNENTTKTSADQKHESADQLNQSTCLVPFQNDSYRNKILEGMM